jgi:hypothetical protein
MTHSNRGRITSAARAFADSRETSAEVAQAIFDLWSDDVEARRVWEDPTPAEEVAVMSDAWRLAAPDEDALFWGGRRTRP